MASVSLCGSVAQNTGEILCDVSKAVGKKLFIFNGAIVEADYATSALFEAKLIANSKLSREDGDKIFPLPEMQDIVDASEANTTGTLGLGFTTIIREGRPAYTVKMFAGAALVAKLRRFNGQSIRIFELDANNRIWGTKSGTDFIGYLAKLFFTGPKLATGQAVEEGICTLTISIMDTSEYNDNSYYQDITNVSSIVGLLDVELVEAAANAANVYKIAVKVPTAQIGTSINVGSQHSTELASAALWSATLADGSALTITTVAYDSALEAFTVTFDSTAYTALAASATIELSLVDPDVLDAADVTNIESNPLVIIK